MSKQLDLFMDTHYRASTEFAKKLARSYENKPLTGDARLIRELRDESFNLTRKLGMMEDTAAELREELRDEKRKFLRFKITVIVIIVVFACFAFLVISK